MHKPRIAAALVEATKLLLCEEPGFTHWASVHSLHTGYSVSTVQAAAHSSAGKWPSSPTTDAALRGGKSVRFEGMKDMQPPSELSQLLRQRLSKAPKPWRGESGWDVLQKKGGPRFYSGFGKLGVGKFRKKNAHFLILTEAYLFNHDSNLQPKTSLLSH